MSRRRGVVETILGAVVRARARLPRAVNRLIDDVAKSPDGPAGRLASWTMGGLRRKNQPAATIAPDTSIRVYIGPTNYAGQGYQWARALEASDERIGARSMAISLPVGFAFPVHTSVPLAVNNISRRWQRAEFCATLGYTHVLFEAERTLFGTLFDRDIRREAAAFARSDVSVAYMAHGTDVRSPLRHMQQTPWSYFKDDTALTSVLQADADRNLRLLEETTCPVFVSTPDLLDDVPGSRWCPVVVDLTVWQQRSVKTMNDIPVVSHIPSSGASKGTHLIADAVQMRAGRGQIEYNTMTNVPAHEMPARVASSDIVLDQFRTGSYGVAACEALASGCIVIGHVLPSVRDRVLQETGLTLPIVEATPDTIGSVLDELLADQERRTEIAALGRPFVEAVHSGALSALVLRRYWIDRVG